MKLTDTADLWWKTAVIYCADVERFLDTDGNGIGDLQGLGRRIDYLAELGVTCLWLMPFYPTPNRDDGYDITDFYGVDPRLGSLGDLTEVLRTAKNRGIRVIADLVVNHTSNQHPWFVEARSNPDSDEHDYYVWRTDKPGDTSEMVVFPGQQKGIWTKDRKAGKWYLHRFYRHQPDLNLGNTAVRDEIAKVVGFWLRLGFDGFRVDAVPQLLTVGLRDELEDEGMSEPHEVLRDLRAFMGRRNGDAVLLGEVNLPYKEQLALFGSPGAPELDLIFDFVAMQNLYLSLARNDAGPLSAALKARPEIPRESQWAVFVRNHDELTLDQLTESERHEVFAAFGPEPRHQVFDRGLRRRLPPMLDGDGDRLRMVYSLMFSLPGTPALYYGEEIGMAENPEIEGRMAVRTPMQWTPAEGGGFSTAPPGDFTAPMVEGKFGPDRVNVEDARNDPDSLFHFFRNMIHLYRRCPELGWGTAQVLQQPRAAVLAHVSRTPDSYLLAVHNLSPDKVSTSFKLPGGVEGDRLARLLGSGLPDGGLVVGKDSVVDLAIGPWGYAWFKPSTDGLE